MDDDDDREGKPKDWLDAAYRMLRRLAKLRLRDWDGDGGDMAQEAMARLHALHSGAPREESQCLSLLATIYINLCRDLDRKQYVRNGALDDPTFQDVAGPRPVISPEEQEEELCTAQVLDALSAEEFHALVDQLSPKLRAVYDLHVDKKKKYKEIALHLGITEGTARKRLHDARNRLEKLIKQHLRKKRS